MAGAYVQRWENSSSANVTSRTVTVSGATANNLLIGTVSVRLGGDAFITPTGWTLISDASTGSFGNAFYYRIASGDSNDNFAASWTDSGKPGIQVLEFSGLDSTSPFEDSAEDESNVSGSATTQGTGTATPVSANGIAVAYLGMRDAETWSEVNLSVNNSFSNLQYASVADGAYGATAVASLPYTSTAGKTATFDCDTDTGGLSYGAIAVFKEAGGGGGPTLPIFDHHYRMMH